MLVAAELVAHVGAFECELCVALAFLCAGVVHGVSGFGAGIVAMAIVPARLKMLDAVPIVAVLWTFVTILVLSSDAQSLKSPKLRATVPWLIAGAVVGVPVGLALLTSVDPRLLRLALGASMLAFVAERTLRELSCCASREVQWTPVQQSNADVSSNADSESMTPLTGSPLVAEEPSTPWRCRELPRGGEVGIVPPTFAALKLPEAAASAPQDGGRRLVDHPILSLLVGFTSGVLSGALNEGGPPVVIFLALRSWRPADVKGTLQVFFLLSSLMSIALLWHRGLVSSIHIYYLTFGLPAAALGIGVGVLVYRHIDQKTFGRVVVASMLVAGVSYVADATKQLIRGA